MWRTCQDVDVAGIFPRISFKLERPYLCAQIATNPRFLIFPHSQDPIKTPCAVINVYRTTFSFTTSEKLGSIPQKHTQETQFSESNRSNKNVGAVSFALAMLGPTPPRTYKRYARLLLLAKETKETQKRSRGENFPRLHLLRKRRPYYFFHHLGYLSRCIRAVHKKRTPVHFISAFGYRMKSLSRTKA
jgi:hypothetical protein